jgi:hypothetical protein
MAGIAYDATLWAIQAGTGVINRPVVEPEFWVAAIRFVRSTPAPGRKVIILQVQTRDFSNIEMVPTIRKEINDAIDEQIVVCVPAGNGNRSGDAGLDDQGLPIPATDSIVVGATNYDPDSHAISVAFWRYFRRHSEGCRSGSVNARKERSAYTSGDSYNSHGIE